MYVSYRTIKPSVPSGCALQCVMAEEPVCRCHCGGENHGKARSGVSWGGFFCEDCGRSFGRSPRSIWDHGCYIQCGTSQKYPSRFGGGGATASYCAPCYLKRHPADATVSSAPATHLGAESDVR